MPSLVRPPFNWWTPDPLTDGPTSSTREIHFLHPGYSYPHNILFSLPALDHNGVHHGVALTACTIVTGNRPGRLSTSRSRSASPRTRMHFDQVLTEPEYYFHPDGDTLDVPYPVCPDFRSWLFPHHRLPNEWAQLAMPAPSATVTPTAYSAEHSCRVTACSDGITNCRIVPREELEWFCANSMSHYNASRRLPASELVLDIRNTFPLRADLASAFDHGKFVFVPKETKSAVHILTPTFELTPLYHNRLVHPFTCPGGPPREFLYARFAHAVFPLLAGFFAAGTRRVCTAGRSGRPGGGLVWEIEWIDWGDILRWRAGSGVVEGIVAVGGDIGREEEEEYA